jgi:hypothetical protein
VCSCDLANDRIVMWLEFRSEAHAIARPRLKTEIIDQARRSFGVVAIGRGIIHCWITGPSERGEGSLDSQRY